MNFEEEIQQPFNSGQIEPMEEVSILRLNTIGKITLYIQLESIEISYKDPSISSKKTINNKLRYTLGDLNQKGFVLIYQGSEEHAQMVETDDYFNDSLDICPKVYFC